MLVRHILIGWDELAPAYHGQQDSRAAKRTHAEAAKLTVEVAAKLRANTALLDTLIITYSEDPGAMSEPYTVAENTPFVAPFKNLALRLEANEIGIVTTVYGYHVMMRVPPPPPDPAAALRGSGLRDDRRVQ